MLYTCQRFGKSRKMRLIEYDWKVYVLALIATLAFTSFFFTSYIGFLCVVLSSFLAISLTLRGFSDNLWAPLFGLLVLLAGVFGAFYENPIEKNAAAILDLAAKASLQPNLFDLSPEAQLQAGALIAACGLEGIATTGKMVSDLGTALYEPPEVGFFSWALKPKFDRKSCLQEAESLATLSAPFKAELDRIGKD